MSTITTDLQAREAPYLTRRITAPTAPTDQLPVGQEIPPGKLTRQGHAFDLLYDHAAVAPGIAWPMIAKMACAAVLSLVAWYFVYEVRMPFPQFIPWTDFFMVFLVVHALFSVLWEYGVQKWHRAEGWEVPAISRRFIAGSVLMGLLVAAVTLFAPDLARRMMSWEGFYNQHMLWTIILTVVPITVFSHAFYLWCQARFRGRWDARSSQVLGKILVAGAVLLNVVGLSAGTAIFLFGGDNRFYHIDCVIRNPICGMVLYEVYTLWTRAMKKARSLISSDPSPLTGTAVLQAA
jgi:hypothetical protein